MELIKKINNNFAVAKDSDGQVIIVMGRGIGFEKMPSVLHDLSKISKSYYDIDNRYVTLLNKIPEDIIQLSNKAVDYASRKLQQKLNPNILFTLADHIDFAIKRYKQGVTFNFGITYEMKYLHPDEMTIGEEIVALINKDYDVLLPEDEASVIAMHILEAKQLHEKQRSTEDTKALLEEIYTILIAQLHISIDKNGFNYCRFVTHVQYLLQRRNEQKEIKSDNKKLYQSMVEEFPSLYECVMEIKAYLIDRMGYDISEEEMLYLMLHMNRLCNNEDCNR